MSSITTDLIKANIHGQVREKGYRWAITLKSGREVWMTETGIYFHDCFGPFLSGEKTDWEAILEFCRLSNALWGCVSLRQTNPLERGPVARFAKARGFRVDKEYFRPFGLSDALEWFGDCSIKSDWVRGGWRIVRANGDWALIRSARAVLSIDEVKGDCYASALQMVNALQGSVVVKGRQDFCIAGVILGEQLGIKIIPEVSQPLWPLVVKINGMQWVLCLALQMILGDFAPFSLPFQIAALAPFLLLPVYPCWRKRMARKRGRALLNQFPQTESRNAKLEDARAKGMI